MMAQLSHKAPLGRPSASSMGVRCAGHFAMNSGDRVWPQSSVSLQSSPAARVKTRTVMLFTLGFRMFILRAGIALLLCDAERLETEVLVDCRQTIGAIEGGDALQPLAQHRRVGFEPGR